MVRASEVFTGRNAPIKKEKLNAVESSEVRCVERLLARDRVCLYHGNKDKDMVPRCGVGSPRNDYGQGFYTTPEKELGKEWAMSCYTGGDVGYLHTYELETKGLNILNLTEYDSLHWIAELLANRTINFDGREALQDTVETFLGRYKLDTSAYDVITGYRADDSYFMYAEDFVSGNIYKETLEYALRYGNLGIQVCIKSERAFKELRVRGAPEIVPAKYKQFYEKRKQAADQQYWERKRAGSRARIKETIRDFV